MPKTFKKGPAPRGPSPEIKSRIRKIRRRKPVLLENDWRAEMELRAEVVKKEIIVGGKPYFIDVKVYPPSDEDVGHSPIGDYGNRSKWSQKS